jgi:hypothetical protein
MRQVRTWAIATRYVDLDGTRRDGFIGRFWFSHDLPEHLSGIPTCTWGSRAAAREALPSVRRGFPQAAVVRVVVSIEEALKL